MAKPLAAVLLFFAAPLLLAQTPAGLQQKYRVVPVKPLFRLWPRISFDTYRVGKSSLGWVRGASIDYTPYGFLGEMLQLPIPRLYATSNLREKFRFQASDASGQQAEVFFLARQKLSGGLLEAIGPQADSAELAKNGDDLIVGSLLIKTMIGKDVWNLLIYNPNQTKGTYTTGTLSDGERTIDITEITTPAEFVKEGRMQEALMVGSIQRGLLFTYKGELAGALDMSRSRRRVWLKKGMDENLRFVVSNLAAVMLLRADLKSR